MKKNLIVITTDYVDFGIDPENASKGYRFSIKSDHSNTINIQSSTYLKEHSYKGFEHFLFEEDEGHLYFVFKVLQTTSDQRQQTIRELWGEVEQVLSSKGVFIDKIEQGAFFLHRGELFANSGSKVQELIDPSLVSDFDFPVSFFGYKHNRSYQFCQFLFKTVSPIEVIKSITSLQEAEESLVEKLFQSSLSFNTSLHFETVCLNAKGRGGWVEKKSNSIFPTIDSFKNKIAADQYSLGELKKSFQGKQRKVLVLFCQHQNLAGYKDVLIGKLKEFDKDEFVCPILLITPFDQLGDFKEEEKGSAKYTISNLLGIDASIAFFDSSIWFRMVSLENNRYGESFQEQLEKISSYFSWAYDNNLYNKNVCKEQRDLHFRLYCESHLKDFGSHASAVVPFRFHSETEMEQSAQEIRGKHLIGLQWDILLIDDFAKKHLRPVSEKAEKKKGELLKSIVEEDTLGASTYSTLVGEFHKQTSFITDDNQEAAAHYLTEASDIILLDYLFSHNEAGEELENPNYGTELLQTLQKNGRFEFSKRNVFNRFWVFPVTVFPDALASSMHRKNIPYINDHYYVARGADPINSPSYFRCSLYQFMLFQCQRFVFNIDEVFNFLAANPINVSDEDKLHDIVSQWAKQVVGLFTELFLNFGVLDETKTSFATTMSRTVNKRKKEHFELYSLIENLHALIYRLAYLTDEVSSKDAQNRAFREIWEIKKSWLKEKEEQLAQSQKNSSISIEIQRDQDRIKDIKEVFLRIGQAIVKPRNNYGK